VHAHLAGQDDTVVTVAPVLDRVGDFAAFLDEDADQPAIDALRLARNTGRPVGAREWIARLEADTRRALAPEKRGPKPRPRPADDQIDIVPTVSPYSAP
jgi:putative transposase